MIFWAVFILAAHLRFFKWKFFTFFTFLFYIFTFFTLLFHIFTLFTLLLLMVVFIGGKQCVNPNSLTRRYTVKRPTSVLLFTLIFLKNSAAPSISVFNSYRSPLDHLACYYCAIYQFPFLIIPFTFFIKLKNTMKLHYKNLPSREITERVVHETFILTIVQT